MVVSQKIYEHETVLGNHLNSIVAEAKDADKLVMIVPDAQASVRGKGPGDDRYAQLSLKINELGASIVRFSNPLRGSYLLDERANMDTMLEFTEKVAGDRAVVGLGFAAGARMLAQYAHNSESINRLILVNPLKASLKDDKIIEGFSEFKHPVRFITGKKVLQGRPNLTEILFKHAGGSPVIEHHMPSVDHAFSKNIEAFVDLACILKEPKCRSN